MSVTERAVINALRATLPSAAVSAAALDGSDIAEALGRHLATVHLRRKLADDVNRVLSDSAVRLAPQLRALLSTWLVSCDATAREIADLTVWLHRDAQFEISVKALLASLDLFTRPSLWLVARAPPAPGGPTSPFGSLLHSLLRAADDVKMLVLQAGVRADSCVSGNMPANSNRNMS